jgi:hypothetical protein
VAAALISGQAPAEIFPKPNAPKQLLHHTEVRDLAPDQMAEIKKVAPSAEASAETSPRRAFILHVSGFARSPSFDAAMGTRHDHHAFGPSICRWAPVWFIRLPPPVIKEVVFVADPGAPVIAALPVIAAKPDCKLGPGSVCLAERLLVRTLGPKWFTGFRIQSGDFSFSADTTLVSQVVHIPAGADVKLVVTLDRPPPPPLPSGPGRTLPRPPLAGRRFS